MKKIVGLLLIATSLTACNDGDIVFENLDFNGIEIQKCEDNELYFKINDKELLLVDFSDATNNDNGSVLDSLAPLNEMQSLTTTNTTKIYYRTYDTAISANAICATLAPANPKVTAEYTSLSGGEILYTRTIIPAVTKEQTVNINYTYTINFRNITLTNGTSEIKYATLPYGSYVYDNSRLSFNFVSNFINCNNLLIGNTGNERIEIQLPATFSFPTSKQTQTITLNNTNSLHYYLFKEPFTDTGCDFPEVELKEDLQALSGTLQIESNPAINSVGVVTGHNHTLKLLQTVFDKEKETFTIVDKTIGTFFIEIE